MGSYAVMSNNNVVNIIDAPSLEIAEEATGMRCIPYASDVRVAIGFTYDEENFIEPILAE